MQKNPMFSNPRFLRTALVICLVLLIAAVIFGSTMYAANRKAASGFRSSQRILEKMSREIVRYAMESRKLRHELTALNGSGPMTIASSE